MASKQSNKFPDIETFSRFDFDEMKEVLERISRENEILETEHSLMNSYSNRITRQQQKLQEKNRQQILQQQQQQQGNTAINSNAVDHLATIDNTDSMSDHSDGASSNATSIPSQMSKKKFLNKRRQREQMITLSIENKIEIVNKEIDDMRLQIEMENKYYEREIEKMRAEFSEADLEIEEIDKENGEFRRDILLGARNPRDDSIVAEKLLKYFEDGLKQKDALLDKLRLKNDTLKVAIRKARTQLEQREDMGEVLSKIDFDQMKIENEQLAVRIEERNNELLRLKLTTGKTMSQLTSLQKKLNNCVAHKQWLKKQIDAREKDLQNLKDDIEEALKEKEKEEKRNAKIRNQHEQVDVPDIIDYVHLKKELDQVRHDVISWERKVEIASVNEKIIGTKFNKLKQDVG